MLNELRVADLLERIGEKTPAPASGAATALTGALAAALAELSARFAADDAGIARARELAAELVRLGDEDAAAYAAYLADQNAETRAETIRVPEEIARKADEVAELAERAAGKLRSSVSGDANASAALARAAASVARSLADLNRGES
ncbi:MAG TPA: cyclodeaminase/cyclohydrolase family protein [Gaiellaceae bacterium]|nr:cyclodeaminase/cyclohydrolase family protein [Gaiellaceae bacterium]